MPDPAGSPSTARDRAAKPTPPRFGAIVRAEYASEGNPQRDGMFVRVVRIPRGRMNAGVWWEITDGNGAFWRQRPENVSVLGHGPLAEVEQLRPVVEAAKMWHAWISADLFAEPFIEGQARVLYGAVAAYRAGGSAPQQGATTDAGTERSIPMDCYDAIELLSAPHRDHASRLLAEAARRVADLWNDPPNVVSREPIEQAWPELDEALFELLGGGPNMTPRAADELTPDGRAFKVRPDVFRAGGTPDETGHHA